MDYREHAKDLLSRKNSLVAAYSALKRELDSLEAEKTACKTTAEKVGKEIYEERLINLLVDIDDCRFRKSIVERDLMKIEKGMETLNNYYRDLINGFFIEYSQEAVEEIMCRWYKERSTVYRDRSRALEEFTRSVYGVVQI